MNQAHHPTPTPVDERVVGSRKDLSSPKCLYPYTRPGGTSRERRVYGLMTTALTDAFSKKLEQPESRAIASLRVLQLLPKAHQSEGRDSGEGGGIDGSRLGTDRTLTACIKSVSWRWL